MFFQSKEEKEAKKERERQIDALAKKQDKLSLKRDIRYSEFLAARESYVQSQLTKWEYTQISNKSDGVWEKINNLGQAGWEMVGIATFAEGAQFKTVYTEYVFKRLLPQLPADIINQFADLNTLNQQILEIDTQIENLEENKRPDLFTPSL